jgi:hypothetical protein
MARKPKIKTLTMTQAAINSIVQDLIHMIQNGVTLANVKASLINRGTTDHLANALVRMAELKMKR